MHFPKITIITLSYNQGAFIEKNIQSILSQGYPHLEYFIIDAGSTDHTVDIIKKYEDQLSYWISEPVKTPSEAINKGLSLASGEIINWINASNFYEPYALFKVANAFSSQRIQVVTGRGRALNPVGHATTTEETVIYPHSLSKTIGWGHFAQPETFFRRSVVAKMGLLDAHLYHLIEQDWWVRYLFLFGLEGIIKIHDHLVNFSIEQNRVVTTDLAIRENEHSFYYALANMYRLYDYVYLFKKHFPIDERLKLQFHANYTNSLVEKAVNYFTLLQAQKLFSQNNDTKAQLILDKVNPTILQEEDKQIYRRMKLKNKYIPKFMVNLF